MGELMTGADNVSAWPYTQAGAFTAGHGDGPAVTVPGSFDEVYDTL